MSLRLLAPLLILFVWNPLPFDCHGGPDTIVGYIAYEARIEIAGYNVCVLEDGSSYDCPFYRVSPWREAARLTTDSYDWPALDVPLGEVAILSIEQVDAAGNVSGGECP